MCVPISRLAECVFETQKDIKDSRLIAPLFGYVGDGNFHTVVSVMMGDADEVSRAKAFVSRLAERAAANASVDASSAALRRTVNVRGRQATKLALSQKSACMALAETSRPRSLGPQAIDFAGAPDRMKLRTPMSLK